jgi:hypothetical protein
MKDKLDKAIQITKAKMPCLSVHADMQKAGQAVLNLLQAKAQYLACENPTDELDAELAFVLGRVRPNLGATEMQQATQAVMHLMQAKALHEALRQCDSADDKPARVNKKTN